MALWLNDALAKSAADALVVARCGRASGRHINTTMQAEEAPAAVLTDAEYFELVRTEFLRFLNGFHTPIPDDVRNMPLKDQQRLYKDNFLYVKQIQEMELNQKTTMVVDFQHILSFDDELASVIQRRFYAYDICCLAIPSHSAVI